MLLAVHHSAQHAVTLSLERLSESVRVGPRFAIKASACFMIAVFGPSAALSAVLRTKTAIMDEWQKAAMPFRRWHHCVQAARHRATPATPP
jgi:hypothetical protein